MHEIFVAIIFLFDASTGQPLQAVTAAFEDDWMCQYAVSQVLDKAAQDMTIQAEGRCYATQLIPSAESE